MKGLALRREKAGLTQYDAAKALGKDRSTIAKWESEAASPSSEALPDIARLYNCTIADLYTGEDETRQEA